ncbi:MAG: pyruvate kinase [Lachnospiraceae bacterium]|jgi:pyruvate kinase|nr:pyruvate kinase [Lachnospiraceae bacterium]MCI1656220.1 pyruvate kinase [Lachnospiraceae bacterium]MCI2194702.1 pyruvate kinase [Lachnospiraceae bacterium]
MTTFRKTKIICTLGPATDQGDTLKQLALNGMNVARFNFSHGSHEEQAERFQKLAAVREETGLPIATLLDTKGPEIRVKDFKEGAIELKEGQKFTLSIGDFLGDENRVAISFEDLYQDVEPGSRILIDDGLIEMHVDEISGTDIICTVDNGGPVSNHKGVNVPNAALSMPFISEKDRSDIEFGIRQGFDFIAASFTRTADDILEIRKILEDNGGTEIQVIAKIENKQGVDNIDDIIRVSDGVMVARGDMGVEIPFEDVPAIQKKIIKKTYTAGKQVITATQMLDSMIKNPRPTRAETADVANAVYDGTSVIMLSGETAAGLYPVEALKTMVRVATRTEQDIDYAKRLKNRDHTEENDITNAIAHATCTTALDLNASAIISVSSSGRTARMVSKYRPSCPIIGCSTYEHVCRRMNMSWGVIPMQLELQNNPDDLFEHAVDSATANGLISEGDVVIVTAGVPLGVSGTTNQIKVQIAGNIMIRGKGVNGSRVSANVCIADSAESLERDFKTGDIIVAKDTDNSMLHYLRQASGLILESKSSNSHGVIAGMSLDLPVIRDASHATEILKTGSYITMDPKRGTVSTAKN